MRLVAITAAILALTAAPAFAATSSAKPAPAKPAAAKPLAAKPAATPAGPYKLNAKGGCHAANGAFVPKAMCTGAPAKPATARCKNAKTSKFAKCGTPGAVPA